MSNVGVNIKIGADSSAGKSMIEDFRNQFKALVYQIKSTALEVKVKINTDTASLAQDIQQIKTVLNSQIGVVKVRVSLETTTLAAQIAQVRTLLNNATGINHQVTLSIDLTRLQAQLNAARAQLASMFGAQSFSVRLGVNLPYLQAQLAAARAMIVAAIANIGSLGSHISVNIDATAPQLIAAINNLKAEIDRLRQAMVAGRGAGGNGGGGGSPSVVGGVGGLGGQIAGIVASLGSLMTLGAFVKVSDEAKQFEGQLRLVTSSESELVQVQKELLISASAAGTQMSSNVDLYTKLAKATQNLNGGSKELNLSLVDTINKLAVVGGGGTQQVDAGLLQLGQALNSTTVQWEEMSGVMDGTPAIFDAIVKGMGVTRGEFKKLLENGEVTPDKIINALIKMGATADEQFAKMPQQAVKSLTSLKNETSSALAAFDKKFGLSDSIVNLIQSIRNNLSDVLAYIASIGAATGITLFAAGIVMAGKALVAKTIQLKTALFAEVERTKAVLAAARAELAAANATVTGATAREIATRGTTAHAAATIALADAMVLQRNATIAATAAQNAATAAASRGALVARGLTLALGGPLGLLLIIGTLASAFLTMRDNGSEATAVLEKMGTTADETREKLEKMTLAQAKGLKVDAQKAYQTAYENTEVEGRKLGQTLLDAILDKNGRATREQSDYAVAVMRGQKNGDDVLAFAKNIGIAGEAMDKLASQAATLDTALQLERERRKQIGVIDESTTKKQLPVDVGTVSRKDVDPKIDQTERERIRLTAAIDADDKYTAQKRANIVSLGNLEITALEAARKKQQGNATELGKIDNQIYEQQLKNQNALAKYDKDAAEEKATKQIALDDIAFKNEKAKIDQEIKDTEVQYKNEEISFFKLYETKRALNERLHTLEMANLDARIAKEIDPDKKNKLEQQRDDLAVAQNARKTDLENEVLSFAKEMKAVQEKTLEQFNNQEISLASDLLGALNVELLNISKTYSDAKKSIDELRRKVGTGALNYEFSDGTKLALNKALLDQWQSILDRQEAIAKEAATRRAAAQSIAKDSKAVVDNQGDYESTINRAIGKDGGWSQLTGNKAINASRTNAYDQLDKQRQELINLKSGSFGSEADELQAQIDTLTEKMQTFKELIPTTFQEFSLNVKQSAGEALSSGINTFFNDIVDGSKTAGEALRDFVGNFARSIGQIIIQALAAYAALLILNAIPGGKAVAHAMDMASSSRSAGVTSGSLNIEAPSSTSAKVQHTGGIAGAGGTRRNIDTSAFLNAPRYHVGGIAGLEPGEIPAILEPGEEVLTRDDPRHAANGGGQGQGLIGGLRIVNAVGDEAIHDAMSSSAGEKVILNVIGRNASAVKQSLEN